MQPISSAFSIKTSVFEGPLELLLDLVERRKLLINDISLASVTEEYLQQVSLMQELSLPNTSQFIHLAATLLLVKSRSLLPIIDLSEEEEASIEDLAERLKRYQIIRDAAVPLQIAFGTRTLYAPQFHLPELTVFVPDAFCTIPALHNAISGVLDALPKTEVKARAQVKSLISLEQMMERLNERIRQNVRTRFSELHEGEVERKVIIVGFLAILELFKQGNLLVTQVDRYADIEIELDQTITPRYY